MFLFKASVNEWDQCGGIGYQGPTQCSNGLTCYILTDHFSQCINLTTQTCYNKKLVPNRNAASSKNWRTLNGVSPVKNQQNCDAWLVVLLLILGIV